MRFESFVIFAEMRTGSNFLESNLNALAGVACHGEAFNPHFIGYPTTETLLGFTRQMRENDPAALLATLRSAGGLNGFRYFHDHDPRILDAVLDDPHCAKIMLSRNPLDSYVSWKIAQETGQWKLTDVQRRKDARVTFDGDEFAAQLDAVQGFQATVLRRLQVSGQSPFHLEYEDLQSVEVMNGLAAWLGIAARLTALQAKLKRQNPEPTLAKVTNPEAVRGAVAEMDPFGLSRVPSLEPRRPPAVPSYVTAAQSPLIFMPILGGPEMRIERWLADLDGVGTDALGRDRSQRGLRQWKSAHPGHRSFAVLSHPLTRAHRVFCQKILAPDGFRRLRETLRRKYRLPVPAAGPDDPGYDLAAHRAAFGAFLVFLKANLNGQTSIRVDNRWASQSAVLRGFAEFVLPDMILREADLPASLADLARRVGRRPPVLHADPGDRPFDLSQVHDPALDLLARDIYPRDYQMFGFGDWPDQAA
ncbi:MAG: nodulation protein NodH [Rhodobacteraceae bacterium]|nr:nodulation protein NodH [Paracoccaceae bacterium]